MELGGDAWFQEWWLWGWLACEVIMFQKINSEFGGFYNPVFSIRVSQDFVFWPIRV